MTGRDILEKLKALSEDELDLPMTYTDEGYTTVVTEFKIDNKDNTWVYSHVNGYCDPINRRNTSDVLLQETLSFIHLS